MSTVPSHGGVRRPARRPTLLGLTVLMSVGILATACMPPSARPVSTPAAKPAPTQPAPVTQQPQPAPAPAPTPTPVPTPEPKPTHSEPAPKPLPEQPAGDPSVLFIHGDRSCNMVALTFDAGSGDEGAAGILDVLKKYGLHSTFFLTGKWVEQFPDMAKRIADEGHEVGNHTYSHPDLTKIEPDAVIKQIKDGEAAIKKATGKQTKLLREPYGAFNDTERKLVRKAGYSYSVYWEVDTLDWQFPPFDTLVKRLTDKPQSGSVVLMHMGVAETPKAVDQVIPLLLAKGLKLVTVSQLITCKP